MTLSKNGLKQKWRKGRPVFGLFCSIPTPVMVEMIGHAGYDFVIVDTEHVLINPETLENMIRAAEAVGLTVLVRVPDASPGFILRALDGGAQGIVVPHVKSRADAEAAVHASRYYPQGERSLNSGRPAAFGKYTLVEYMQRANEEILVVVMIEDREGIEHIDDILSVQGVDMVLEGAADLSQSYGIPWQTRGLIVKEALCRVEKEAKKKGIPYCAIPRVPEDFQDWYNRGVRSFILGDERGIAFRAFTNHLNIFQTEPSEAISIKERENT